MAGKSAAIMIKILAEGEDSGTLYVPTGAVSAGVDTVKGWITRGLGPGQGGNPRRLVRDPRQDQRGRTVGLRAPRQGARRAR